MNSDERQRKIIEFVETHPGCLTERVIEALKQFMSRKTFFKELDILKEKGEIIVKAKNKRDKELYVDKNNLLITVPKELEQFEKDFLDLAETISTHLEMENLKMSFDESIVNKLTNADNKLTDYYQASYQLLLNILFHIVDSYIFRFLIKWSSSNLKGEDKIQLFSIIFSKISKILIKLPEFFPYVTLENGDPNLYAEIYKRLEGAKPILTLQTVFSRYKVEDQVNKVIDNMWNIDREICEFVYKEPLYKFDFDYKKDGWKQLVKKYEPYFEQNENL